MLHYWMTFQNDGLEITDNKCATKAEALKELKEAYKADCIEYDGDACEAFEYYVTEFHEDDSAIYYGPDEYYKMSLGPRGGVKIWRVK